MEQLKNAYNKIDEMGIKMFSYNIPFSKSVTIESNGKYGIFIDYNKIEDSYDEFMVLAHEYGHCVSGSTHSLNSPADLISKHEYIADKTAAFEFLPVKNIINAVNNGCHTIEEISDYLDLPL